MTHTHLYVSTSENEGYCTRMLVSCLVQVLYEW